MKVRGIKRGQNIEILEELNNIPDGTEIIIDVEFRLLRWFYGKALK
jgi:antitoxin ParD1/3/4